MKNIAAKDGSSLQVLAILSARVESYHSASGPQYHA
jgi:hypothetical protein